MIQNRIVAMKDSSPFFVALRVSFPIRKTVKPNPTIWVLFFQQISNRRKISELFSPNIF